MNKSQLLELIANGVSSELSFKSADITSEELAREIVAMANFRGGRILLGVARDGVIKGFHDQNIEDWVKSVVRQNVNPMLFPSFAKVEISESEFVLVLTLPKGPRQPYVLYLKPGDEKLTDRIPQRVLSLGNFDKEMNIPYPDSLPVDRSSFDDLNKAKLEFNFQNIIKDPALPHTRSEWERRLKDAGLMHNESFMPRCTMAGVLLFAKEPQIFFTQGISLCVLASKIKEERKRGFVLNARLDTYIRAPFLGNPIRLGSLNIPQKDGQIEECLAQVQPFIKFNKQTQYSALALKEVLINAFAHKDWFFEGPTKVDVYTDRIEVRSVGTMCDQMTLKKMLAGQRYCKHPTLMRVLREYNYASYSGSGVSQVILPEMAKHGIKPIFEVDDLYFKVILPCR